jgi:putative acetyltransferase
MTSIRRASVVDQDKIREVHLNAFAPEETSNIAELATNLLMEPSQPGTLSWVAEIDGSVVGHIAFSPVFSDACITCIGNILAPLGVKPDFQNRHIGSDLVAAGIQHLSQMGFHVLLVYGDPDFYGRFGFHPYSATHLLPPYPLKYPSGWLARNLHPHIDEQIPIQLSCLQPLCHPDFW